MVLHVRALAPWLVLVLSSLPTALWAQQSACPEGNLLAGKQPKTVNEVMRPARVNDGIQPQEGGQWDTPGTAIFKNEESYIEFDLGAVTMITAASLQADVNDSYELGVSVDGEHYTSIWSIPGLNPEASGHGMRTRANDKLSGEARFVRIGHARGDGYFSIGEWQVFCQRPAAFPPKVTIVPDRAAEQPQEQKWDREHTLAVQKIAVCLLSLLAFVGLMWPRVRDDRKYGQWVTPIASVVLLVMVVGFANWQVGFWAAVVGVGALFWLRSLRKKGKQWLPKAERFSLYAIMIASAMTYTNFFTFHGVRPIHLWDSMHYYVGSKYFKENRYTHLYHCGALAEIDDGRKDEVVSRKYRNLKTNALGPAEWILPEIEECRAKFTPERWAAFRQDLRLFRELMSPGWFKDSFQDHGYNASPVWNMIGSVISNIGWRDQIPPDELVNSPANLQGKTDGQRRAIMDRFERDKAALYSRLGWIAMLDAFFYIAAFVVMLWAFGPRVTALAMVVFATAHPWAYYWTGGSFARNDYFFMMVAGVGLLKKGQNFMGAWAVTWSALLRIFPAALAGGVLMRILWNVGRRRFERHHLFTMAGATAALVILIGLSLPSAGGLVAYPEFYQNSVKHKSTPLTNHMGLPTLVSYSPSMAARNLKNGHLEDPFADWKRVRRELLSDRAIVYWGIVALLFFGVAYLNRNREDWEATAWSSIFLIALYELTCYYYNFMVLSAPMAIRRLRYVIAYILMSVGTQVAELTVGWLDERYVLETALVFGMMVYVMIDQIIEERRAAELGQPTAVPKQKAAAA